MPTKVMIIRHAEKPGKNGSTRGVTAEGELNEGSLTVRGWQRAGALAQLFAPANKNFDDPRLETPAVIYASNSNGGSQRPLETIRPLAEKFNIDPVETFTKGEEVDLVAAVLKEAGAVLICWQHERIVGIAKRLTERGLSVPIPDAWPNDRFDIVWIFTSSSDPAGRWEFSQVPQGLLEGDEPTLIGTCAPHHD